MQHGLSSDEKTVVNNLLTTTSNVVGFIGPPPLTRDLSVMQDAARESKADDAKYLGIIHY